MLDPFPQAEGRQFETCFDPYIFSHLSGPNFAQMTSEFEIVSSRFSVWLRSLFVTGARAQQSSLSNPEVLFFLRLEQDLVAPHEKLLDGIGEILRVLEQDEVRAERLYE